MWQIGHMAGLAMARKMAHWGLALLLATHVCAQLTNPVASDSHMTFAKGNKFLQRRAYQADRNLP